MKEEAVLSQTDALKQLQSENAEIKVKQYQLLQIM